jgi:hypothetical protein
VGREKGQGTRGSTCGERRFFIVVNDVLGLAEETCGFRIGKPTVRHDLRLLGCVPRRLQDAVVLSSDDVARR